MRNLGIAIIGAGMIGAAHAGAYRNFLPKFAQKIKNGSLHTICDANQEQAEKLAVDYGFAHVSTNWSAVLENQDIGIVSICLPNFMHVEVTREALLKKCHVLCEKPLALSASEAEPLVNLAKINNSISGTVFNYRRIPAIAEIKQRISNGDIGDIVQIIVNFQCDYASDPQLPHSWRYEFAKAGPGALLDIGTHAIDMARFLCGEVSEVTGAIANISIKERFLPAGSTTGHQLASLSTQSKPVDNDDVMSALLRFENGAQGFLSASRIAIGKGNVLTLKVFGSKGTLEFDLLNANSYQIALLNNGQRSTFQTCFNDANSPYIKENLPVPHDGVAVGYAEVFGFMIAEFLQSIANNTPFSNGSLNDGYQASRILDAIQQASDSNQPVRL
ncbi:Gfo/Idh/MocA family oxidoreductase [Bartonella sp. HY329]|uniref:Gfo/Idh/MocA family protein n=1 Tax=unclassified Bartonella TaxID=2645622 RepID=UPI0021C88811|nr:MULTISPECIES: Gfo/Idh/MocA family oxidoreductase [unclassified Bartonella]UXM95180.1 Gfo/Idh/MocA family oxidoreductase [Bartonella sp. HY329]UXN09503.1 Gfo/Idh/MocA family oxidoreductase [Bartonella sp. HY328]